MLGEKLEDLEIQSKDCRECVLCDTRKNLVWGSGNPRAEIMIIGEAPGKFEDEGGVPFVGKSGDWLDDFLARAGLARDDIYIANILKCRPPKNRDPLPEEIKACEKWLVGQIHAIEPRVIVSLGAFAAKWVLHDNAPITTLQGTVFKHEEYLVLPCYHPAAVIYDRKKASAYFAVAETLGALLEQFGQDDVSARSSAENFGER